MTTVGRLQPFSLTAAKISDLVRSREVTIGEVAEFYIQRTNEIGPRLNSHIGWQVETIRDQVKAQERRLQAGESLPLAGVPIVIKDNICTLDHETTCASKMLAGFRPTYDAHVVERLRQAGALIFGKANCDEFAMGSSNENSAFGPVRNPWQLERVPGGSSGGSAASVAADLAPVALGSDTGGSIRQPAAFCGVYGLKPTYGAVSRFGLIAYASSLDQIGPFGRTALDTALIYDIISGHDNRDSTSRSICPRSAVEDLSQPARDLKGLRIGLVRELMNEGLDEATNSAVLRSCEVYRQLGAQILEVSLPSLRHSVSAYYLIATAEASANLARFDGIRFGHRATGDIGSIRDLYQCSRSEGFGKEVKQRIMLGTFALSSGYYDAYYAKAEAARQLIAKEFVEAFDSADLLMSPVSPTTAYKIGTKSQDPLTMYLSDICTLGVNLAGLPALSVPSGFDRDGLPIGVQLIGPAMSESKLLLTADAFEKVEGQSLARQPSL